VLKTEAQNIPYDKKRYWYSKYNNTAVDTALQNMTLATNTLTFHAHIPGKTIKPAPFNLHFSGVQSGSVLCVCIASVQYNGLALGVEVGVDTVAHLWSRVRGMNWDNDVEEFGKGNQTRMIGFTLTLI